MKPVVLSTDSRGDRDPVRHNAVTITAGESSVSVYDSFHHSVKCALPQRIYRPTTVSKLGHGGPRVYRSASAMCQWCAVAATAHVVDRDRSLLSEYRSLLSLPTEW